MHSKIFLVLFLAFLFRLVLAFIVWHPDVNNHVDWGIRFWQYGPADFYRQNVWSFSWPNQPPGTMLIFALIRKLFEGVFNFFWWINITVPLFPSNIMLFFEGRLYQALLKLPAILADLGIGYIIFRFFKQQGQTQRGWWAANLFLWNPVVWYNSSIWGQTDAIVNFFGLGSLLLLLERRLSLAVLALVVSLFIKASLLPLVLVFLVVAWRQQYPGKTWVRALAISFGIVGLLTLPFARSEPFFWLFKLYQDKIFGWQLHLITANAFNLWTLVATIHERSDTLLLGPMSFSMWGYLLFTGAFVFVVARLYHDQTAATVLWVAALVMFASFTLLTGMHERYLYPLFPFLTIVVAQNRKLLGYLGVISAIHLLNLYNFWWYPPMDPIINFLSAHDRLVPRILGGIMTALFALLYLRFWKRPTGV